MNMQQLRERYAAPEIPKCRVCGGVLTVQRAGGGPTIWGCTGMIDDPTGERNWIYAEGRSCADEHYERSRWSDYRQGGDADVIELIDALEAAERERDELRAEQAEHDEQIARMESKFSLAKRALDSKTARCEKAEAELRRRDAAAGEPVAVLYRNGDVLTKAECGEYFEICCKVETPLYTTPPAASVPDVNFDLSKPGTEATVITHYQVPDGWKLVPLKAFPSQWAAGQKAFDAAGINKIDPVYHAMVEAAPAPGGDDA